MATLDETLSSFPTSLDSFNEVFDLNPSQFEKAKRLEELKLKQSLNTSEQQEILSLTSELKDFMITSAHWNKMGSAIYSVQKFFNENVKDYIFQKQALWSTYVNSFRYIGAWQSGHQYEFQNMATDERGDLWLCKKAHISSLQNKPKSSGGNNFWQRVSAKGDKGDTGLAINYRGEWSQSTNYSMGDGVTINNLIYYAKKSNIGRNPLASHEDWFLFDKLVVSNIRPQTQKGTHWIEVIE